MEQLPVRYHMLDLHTPVDTAALEDKAALQDKSIAVEWYIEEEEEQRHREEGSCR